MRIVPHFILVVSATVLWALAMLILLPALGLILLADVVWPNATHGNCWSFSVPRWWRSGGSLQVRAVHDTYFLGGRIRLCVPHAGWIHTMPADVGIQRTEPLERYVGEWLLFHNWVYFPYRVEHHEPPNPLHADPYQSGATVASEPAAQG